MTFSGLKNENYDGLYLIMMCLVLRLMSLDRPVRRLDLRVFQHATEDLVKVMAALRLVSGAPEASENRAEGFHGNPIGVLEVSVTGRSELEAFWARLRDAGLCGGVAENLEERINEAGELFIRFDKQEAVLGRLALSSGDDVVLARGRVLATVKGQEVRADRNAAVEVMREFLRELEKRPGAVSSEQ
jgi:RNA binding exosome subunit